MGEDKKRGRDGRIHKPGAIPLTARYYNQMLRIASQDTKDITATLSDYPGLLNETLSDFRLAQEFASHGEVIAEIVRGGIENALFGSTTREIGKEKSETTVLNATLPQTMKDLQRGFVEGDAYVKAAFAEIPGLSVKTQHFCRRLYKSITDRMEKRIEQVETQPAAQTVARGTPQKPRDLIGRIQGPDKIPLTAGVYNDLLVIGRASTRGVTAMLGEHPHLAGEVVRRPGMPKNLWDHREAVAEVFEAGIEDALFDVPSREIRKGEGAALIDATLQETVEDMQVNCLRSVVYVKAALEEIPGLDKETQRFCMKLYSQTIDPVMGRLYEVQAQRAARLV